MRSRRSTSLRVSQPFRSASAQFWPNWSRLYPVFGARPLTGSVASFAAAVSYVADWPSVVAGRVPLISDDCAPVPAPTKLTLWSSTTIPAAAFAVERTRVKLTASCFQSVARAGLRRIWRVVAEARRPRERSMGQISCSRGGDPIIWTSTDRGRDRRATTIVVNLGRGSGPNGNSREGGLWAGFRVGLRATRWTAKAGRLFVDLTAFCPWFQRTVGRHQSPHLRGHAPPAGICMRRPHQMKGRHLCLRMTSPHRRLGTL